MAVVALACVCGPTSIAAQRMRDIDPRLLSAVMPEADRFSEREGAPIAMRAYSIDPETGTETLIGYAFHTSDIPPEQIGYSGPIEALVGMDLTGHITGVRVTYYWESIQSSMGDFLRTRGFQEHFSGKYIGDAFQPYRDVEGISRATISVGALARGVRDAARRVAEAYLTADAYIVASGGSTDDTGRVPTWLEMRQRGIVQRATVRDAFGAAEINLAYIESDPFGEFLVGATAMTSAKRALESRGGDAHLMVYGVDGSRPRIFSREGWSVAQGGDTIELAPTDVRSFGLAAGGMMKSQVVVMGAMLLDSAIDMSKPFTLLFDVPSADMTAAIEYVTAEAQLAAELEEDAAPAGVPAGPPAPAEISVPSGPELPGSAEQPSATAQPVTTEQPGEAARSTGTEQPAAIAPSTGNGQPAATAQPITTAQPTQTEPPTGAESPSGASAPPQIVPAPLDFTVVREESVLARTLSQASGMRVGGMLLALILATLAFFAKKTWLRAASLAVTFVYLGFLDGSFLSISHITAGIWRGPSVYVSDLPLLLLVTFTVVTTLFWGRVFCGYLCPFGALQDLLDRVVPNRFKRVIPALWHKRALYMKYVVLAVILVPAIAGSRASLYQYFEPFGTVFFGSPSRVLWLIAGLIVAASAVIPRFYCRYACPLGAALAVGSLISLNRIKRVEQCGHCSVCEQKCPTGAIEKSVIDFKECVRCNVCEIKLVERAGVCRHDIDDVRSRLVQIQVGATSGAGHDA